MDGWGRSKCSITWYSRDLAARSTFIWNGEIEVLYTRAYTESQIKGGRVRVRRRVGSIFIGIWRCLIFQKCHPSWFILFYFIFSIENAESIHIPCPGYATFRDDVFFFGTISFSLLMFYFNIFATAEEFFCFFFKGRTCGPVTIFVLFHFHSCFPATKKNKKEKSFPFFSYEPNGQADLMDDFVMWCRDWSLLKSLSSVAIYTQTQTRYTLRQCVYNSIIVLVRELGGGGGGTVFLFVCFVSFVEAKFKKGKWIDEAKGYEADKHPTCRNGMSVCV